MYNAVARTKLSRKYIPPGNPGGANFNADEEFAESYKLYEKRRELLKKKKLQGEANKNLTREGLTKTLKEKNIVNSYDEHQGTCIVDDEGDAMIDQHGINLARLKGAVFVDREEVLRDNNQQNRPKKISPVSVAIQDASFEKMICTHDSINDLKMNTCSSDSTLFDSVVDAAE